MRVWVSKLHTVKIVPIIVFVLLIANTINIMAQTDPIPLPPPPNANSLQPSGNVITAPQGSNPRNCATNTDPVQPAWFYKPAANMSIAALSSNFDTFVLTKGDESKMRDLHDRGEYPVLQYIKYDAIHDPCFQALKPAGTACSCGQAPKRNNVGWKRIDVCWIRDNHPEWFMRDADGNLLYWNDYVMMDLGEPGWQDFWLERIKQSQGAGWDGVFIDNMATRFGIHGTNFVPLLDYPTHLSYQNAVVGFLEKMRTQYFVPRGKKMYGNISVRWGDTEVFLRFMNYMDGAQDEFWAYPRTGWYTVRSWEDRLLRSRASLAMGKKQILVSLGDETDYQRQLFGLASYLLIASPNTYFRYARQDRYQYAWIYENYFLQLGEPLGNYTTNGTAWRRNFANGKVTVKPGTHYANIEIYDGGCVP